MVNGRTAPDTRRYYKLVDRVAVPCGPNEARLQQTEADLVLYRNRINNCSITTTFLTVDMAPEGAPPQLFSTLIVPDGGEAVKLWLTSSWSEATTRHARAECLVRDNLYHDAMDSQFTLRMMCV